MTFTKEAFINPSTEEFGKLTGHIQELINIGFGETVLSLGVEEDVSPGLSEEEMHASIDTVNAIAKHLNAVCVQLLERTEEKALKTVKLLVRQRPAEGDFVELRICVVGNVDAGKTTLLGVLTHGTLDNGRGIARQKIFRHKHEMDSGRTSSVANEMLGFNAYGDIVNQPVHGQLEWAKIVSESSKVITFIDLAGHERYLKTTVFGMTGCSPHYAMLVIGANAGCIGMTKEHLGLALALAKPVFVVVTKLDMCPQPVFEDTMKLLTKLLKSPGCRKLPIVITDMEQVVNAATSFTCERICPIFCISSVDGRNLHLLKRFLGLLTPQTVSDQIASLTSPIYTNIHTDKTEQMEELEALPAEFHIDETFLVPGVGTVVSGICVQGKIKLNDVLFLGPDRVGNFTLIPIKSIHRKRLPVCEVHAQQSASFALKRGIRRNNVRRGMVLVSPQMKPMACWEFSADILILHHPTTIAVRYQAVLHIGAVRQTVTLVSMDNDVLRTGDRATVRLRFIKQPEYLGTCGNEAGRRFVFREGKTKAVGCIREIFPLTAPTSRQKFAKRSELFSETGSSKTQSIQDKSTS